jgi:hypothetical protein
MKLHKLFLILFLTLLLPINIFGQAAVDIPFSVTDGTWTANLSIGLDLTATTCIDSTLGEYVFNVMPPAGVFDSRLDLAPYGCGTILFTLKDYRPPGDPPAFPFSGMIEHTLAFQTSSIGMSIYIQYNLPPGTTMLITDQIGGSFLNLGPFTGQGIATIPGSYTMIFSRALLKMEYDNIVPVELTSFTASILQSEKSVQLNWTTATETNNSGFEIQRTSPLPSSYQGEGGEAGRGWEIIGFVPGFGTTTEPKSYSFIDKDVTTGIYKYRLKQIDFDGSFTYSNEIEVEVDFTPKEFVLYQNYPNPFNPTTTIKYEVPSVTLRQSQSDIVVTLKVYDILGNEVATLVNEEKQPGVYEVEFNGENYSSGVYYYVMSAGNFINTMKFVLIK